MGAELPGDPGLGTPDATAVARAMRVIKTTFKTQYAAATTPALRIELATHFLKEAAQTRDDPPGKFVLLTEARDLAANAGDASIARKAVLELARSFGVSAGEMMLQALAVAARSASSPGAIEAAARAAMLSADEELTRDDCALAAKFIAVAQGAASRSRRASLSADVQDKSNEVAWANHEREEAKSALEAVQLEQADAQKKFLAGRYRCLVKGDFEHGLPLAAEGSDSQWQTLAQSDRAAAGADARTQARLADEWWELAASQQSPRARFHCRMRAAHWYRRALAGLSGLTRSTAEQRIEEFEQSRFKRMNLEPGLIAELFAGEKFEQVVARRVDSQLDFEWSGAPAEDVPRDHFSIRWSGRLRVPASGLYTLILHANEGARVFLDDKLIVDLPDGAHKRSGKKETLTLAEGLHDFRVEYWEAGGLARMRLLWSTPLNRFEEPVPAQFFLHNAGDQKEKRK